MSRDEHKRAAACAAIAELPEAGVIGLGTGSTARYFIEEVAALVKTGRRYVGVPTSTDTRALAESLGIELLDDDGPWDVLVCVDGADEIDPDCNVIKGGGAAHTRERIVNFAARRNVIIADASKLSARVGTKSPIPVEVMRFGHRETARALAPFGEPRLRSGVTTDNGNVIYDVAVQPLEDPSAVARALRLLPGVVEVGLFVGRVDVAIVAGDEGIQRLARAPR
jgi:ribose 5-phosphate isomerase A